MRRRFLILLLLACTIVFAAVLSACAIGSDNRMQQSKASEGKDLAPAIVPPICRALWELDTGFSGYQRTNAYRMQTYTCGEVALTVHIRPQGFDDFNSATWERIGAGDSTVSRFRSLTTPEGLPYHLLNTAVNWDAKDESGWHGGTLHTQSLHLDEGGLCFMLDGETATDHRALEIVSLETLRKLTDHSADLPSGSPEIKKTHEVWRTEFQNDPVSLGIWIVPPPFDADAFAQWAGETADRAVLRQQDGSAEYLQLYPEKDPDAPLATSIACRSEVGMLVAHGGVPYTQRKTVSRETLDMITIEWVRGLIETLVG